MKYITKSIEIFYLLYSPPNSGMTVFENFCKNLLSKNDKTLKKIILADDLNINVLDYESNKETQQFLSIMFLYNIMPTVIKSTRVKRNTATAIDRIIINTKIK